MTTLFRFLKKLFQFGSEESIPASLMEKARMSALLSDNLLSSDNLTFKELTKFYDDDELDQFQFEQMIQEHERQHFLFQQRMEEEMREQQLWQDLQHMHDPYQNPGQDIVVDEVYHHIDHGLD